MPHSTVFPYCESRNRPADPKSSPAFRAPKRGMTPLRNAFFTAFCSRDSTGSGNDRGSLSVEAACVFPLFLMVLCALLTLFSVIQTELMLGTAVSDTARELMRSSDPDLSGRATATALQAFRENGGEADGRTMLSGLEITADESGESDQAVRITARYRISVPFFSRFSLRMPLGISASMRPWSGKSFEEAENTRLVYVTQTGSVYHTSRSCRSLSPGIITADFSEIPDMRNKDGKIYYPCEICGLRPHGEQVFVTNYGTRWHADRNCSGIRRGIRRIRLNETGGMPLCSFCRERDGE